MYALRTVVAFVVYVFRYVKLYKKLNYVLQFVPFSNMVILSLPCPQSLCTDNKHLYTVKMSSAYSHACHPGHWDASQSGSHMTCCTS